MPEMPAASRLHVAVARAWHAFLSTISNLLAFCDKLISGTTRTLKVAGGLACARAGVVHFPVTRRDFLRS
jgi:hypothetical protein